MEKTRYFPTLIRGTGIRDTAQVSQLLLPGIVGSCFIPSPESMFYTDRVNRYGCDTDAFSVGMKDDVLLLPKLGQLFCLRTRLWNSYRAFQPPRH